MKQLLATVLSNEPAMEGVNLLWLGAPELAQEVQPGQFLMVRCTEGLDPLLRRALSIHRVRAAGSAPEQRGCAVLYGVHGLGTAALARKQPGDTVDVLGPLGRGFSVPRGARHLLLVGASWGVSPLVALAEQQVAQGRDVTLLAGAPRQEAHYPAAWLPPQVEVVFATEDGSLGKQGLVTDLAPEYWEWADAVFACGPWALYQTLGKMMDSQWPQKPVQVLAELPMACGVGACYSCAVETKRGIRLSCREGPRFDLKELLL